MKTSEHKQTFIQEMKRRGYRENSIQNYSSCIDVFLSKINKDHPKNINEQDIKDFLGNCIKEFALDKDILLKGNKIYSPETCCFVPQEINNLFIKRLRGRGKYPIGVSLNKGKYFSEISCGNTRISLGYFDTPQEAFQAYKTAKEAYIKEVADKWRGQITEQVYEAMYNYKVEIDD